jgi:DnaJ-class molecular chaperone
MNSPRKKQKMGELVSEVARLFDGIDTLSYYVFLDLPADCDYVAVRDAFYGRAQRFHPDRFVATYGVTVKEAVYAVYKRMTEAYNVLSSPELRASYDEGLQAGEVRLAAVKRSRRLDALERQVSNPFARIYMRAARAKLDGGQLNAAWIDCELGLSLEEAQPLQDLHVEIVRAMAGR